MKFEETAFVFLVDKSGSMATFEKSNYEGLGTFLLNAPQGFAFAYTKHRVTNDDILDTVSFVPNRGNLKASNFEEESEVQNNCTRLGDAINEWSINAISPYRSFFNANTSITLFFIIVSDGLQDSSFEYSISRTRHALEFFRIELARHSRTVNPYIFYFGLNDFTRNEIDAINPDAWCLARKEYASECYLALANAMNNVLERGDVNDFISAVKNYFDNTITRECGAVGISIDGLLNSGTNIIDEK